MSAIYCIGLNRLTELKQHYDFWLQRYASPWVNYSPHDIDVPRMVEMWLVVAIYVSATSVDHHGWPAVVWSGMFAQWLILSCLVTSKGVVFVFGLTQSVATSCHKNQSYGTFS